MTYQTDCTLPEELLEQIAQQGLDVLPDIIRTVINTAMQIERQNFLGVGPYERSPERRDHANSYKSKTVATRVGKIAFDVPQVRDGTFYLQSLEKGLRSERALKLALAEMYVQGGSTRKIAAITEQLCGVEVSSTQVRQDGQVREAAALKADGPNEEGKRMVLGVSVSLSEQEVYWCTFLQSLVDRGLSGVEIITSDAHTGLKQARRAIFGGVPWQRCQYQDWVWYSSDVVLEEIEQTPDSKRRERVMQLNTHTSVVYQISETNIVRAGELAGLGFSSMDALHIACAESCGADAFLTPDDRLFRRATRLVEQLQVVVENPLNWLVRQQESES